MPNIPELISKMATGNGVFKGDAVFALADGSFVDKDGKEVAAASPIAASAYSSFEGFAVPSEVTAEATALSAAAASGAVSTHNTDAGAHAILARKTETMRLLISRTIGAEENVSAITWTQDDAGNALNLLGLEIMVYVPLNNIAVGTTGTIGCRFNDFAGASDYFSVGSISSSTVAGLFRTQYGSTRLNFNYVNGRLVGFTTYSAYDGTTRIANIAHAGTLFSAASITKIYLFLSAAGLTYVPEGTVIQIYGRTA